MMLAMNRLSVMAAGGVPVPIGPGRIRRLDGLDGLVIGGGVDIESRLYGIDTTDEWPYDPERDALEMQALDWAERGNRPVLGICRGAQLMNVHRGGTLLPDLKVAHPGHRFPRSVFPCKSVDVARDSRLADLLGAGRLRINALHHQAVDRLGKGLAVSAREPLGIVQGIERADHPFWIGVQWHPEFLIWRPPHHRLFRALVRAVDRDSVDATSLRARPEEAPTAVR